MTEQTLSLQRGALGNERFWRSAAGLAEMRQGSLPVAAQAGERQRIVDIISSKGVGVLAVYKAMRGSQEPGFLAGYAYARTVCSGATKFLHRVELGGVAVHPNYLGQGLAGALAQAALSPYTKSQWVYRKGMYMHDPAGAVTLLASDAFEQPFDGVSTAVDALVSMQAEGRLVGDVLKDLTQHLPPAPPYTLEDHLKPTASLI